MFRLLSIFAIVGACAALLVGVGQAAFGVEATRLGDGLLHGVFKSLPVETAYAAPLVAMGLVAGAFFVLRMIGWFVSIGGAVMIFAMLAIVFARPEWLQQASALLGAGG